MTVLCELIYNTCSIIHDRKFKVSHGKLSKIGAENSKPHEKDSSNNYSLEKWNKKCKSQFLVYVPTCARIKFGKTKHWVRNHNGTSDDTLVYTDHVFQLLKSEHPHEFEEICGIVI